MIFKAMRLLVLVELVGVTFIIAFDVVYPLRRTIAIIACDVILTSLLLLGVAARFNTSFVSPRDNIEILDREDIRQVLLNTRTLWMDAVALCAAPLLYWRNGLGDVLALLRLLKCWRLPRTFRRSVLLEHQSLHGLNDQLAYISIGIFVATHLYACVWFQAKVHSPFGFGHEWSAWNGWSIDVFQIEKADEGSLSIPLEFGTLSDLYFCYARAFRDGAYMLISWNGPNAISALELVTIGILSPLSGLIMAYVYALFVSSIEQSRMLEKQLVERMSVLGDACRDMFLPDDLRDRILRYHSFLSMHHLGAETQDLFQQLSANLTCEMRMFRMRNVIFSANFFEGLSHRLVLLLVQTFVEQAFAPGDMVVRKGEVADCMYIILRGAVTVLTDDEASRVVTKMQEGSVFGELCFVQEHMTRTAWIRAETYLVVWRFDKANFEALLDSHDDARNQMVNHILTRVKDFVDFQHTDTLSRRVSAILETSETLADLRHQFSHLPSAARRLSAMSEKPEEDETSSSSGLSSGETTPLISSHRSCKDMCPTNGRPAQGAREISNNAPSTSQEAQSIEQNLSKVTKHVKAKSETIPDVVQARRRSSAHMLKSRRSSGGRVHTAPTISLTGAEASIMRRASFSDILAPRTSYEANQSLGFGLPGLPSEDRNVALPVQRRPSITQPLMPQGLEEPKKTISDLTAEAVPGADGDASRLDPNVDPNAPKVDGTAIVQAVRRRRSSHELLALDTLVQQQATAVASLDQLQLCQATHNKVLELEKRVDKLGKTLQTDLASQQALLINVASQLARIEAALPGKGECAPTAPPEVGGQMPSAGTAMGTAGATSSSTTAGSAMLSSASQESKAAPSRPSDLTAELASDTTAAVSPGSGIRSYEDSEDVSARQACSREQAASNH